MTLYPYDRQAAVDYAHRWAYHRNPDFYSFDELGGDCTNTPTFGWYYNSQYSRAPAWTGVPFFYNFLTRKKETPGPVGEEAEPAGLLPGDFAQLRFAPGPFAHNPVIVSVGSPPALDNILVAAHSEDADYRPLSTYPIQGVRFLHIVGVRR